MKRLVIALALLLPIPAMAQAVQSTAPTEYSLKLLPAEVDIVGRALGTQPFNDAAPLINKIRQQVIEQQPKPVEPVKEPEKK